MRFGSFVAIASLGVALFGCSSVGSSAVSTGGMPPRPNVGPVRVYAIAPPPDTRVVGFVEVHAIQDEANLETLMPVFLRRVRELGGSGGVVDHVLTGYEWRTEMRYESFAYPCGYRATCYGSHLVPFTYEVRFLTIQGRAIVPAAAPNAKPMPAPAPAPTPNAGPPPAPMPTAMPKPNPNAPVPSGDSI
jgi:hypothetical protein